MTTDNDSALDAALLNPRAWKLGALFCAAYALLHLMVSGIIIDESVVPAQIIAGAVEYPAGHPHQVYYPRTLCLPNYLSAGLWLLLPDPLAISALRNFAFLLLSAFVPFLLATVLTRRSAWGFVAAALTLTDATVVFKGNYPFWVFPHFYSHGHVGVHTAVLTATLLVARCWRMGGLLLGILPAVHLSMPFVVWPWSICYFLLARRRPRGAELRRLIPALAVGLAISGAFALLISGQSPGAPEPPYDARVDGAEVYRNFTALTDVHRFPIEIRSLAYFVGPLILLTAGALPFWIVRRRRNGASDARMSSPARSVDLAAWGWILFLAAVVWAYVYGTALVRAATGWLPSFVLMSMPGRFSNLSLILLIPVAVTSLAALRDTASEAFLPASGALLAGSLLAATIFVFVDRLGVSLLLMFVLWGLVLAAAAAASWKDKVSLTASAGCAVIAGAVLLRWFQGRTEAISRQVTRQDCKTAALLAGLIGGTLFLALARRLASRFARRGSKPGSRDAATAAAGKRLEPILSCFSIILAASTLGGPKLWDQWNGTSDAEGKYLSRWDQISPFDLKLKAWLDEHSRPGELILPALVPRSQFQPKTAHPVLMEIDTMHLMTYKPSISPAIWVMAKEIFGVDYADPASIAGHIHQGRLGQWSPIWRETWEKRSLDEWKALGKKFRFRLVLALTQTRMSLPAVLEGPLWTLYEIPS